MAAVAEREISPPRDPWGIIDVTGTEWIPTWRAADLIISPARGKRVHPQTILRWIHEGRLVARRRPGLRGKWVRLDDIERMNCLESIPGGSRQRGPARETQAILDRFYGKRRG